MRQKQARSAESDLRTRTSHKPERLPRQSYTRESQHAAPNRPCLRSILIALTVLFLAGSAFAQVAPTTERPAPYPTYYVGDLGLMYIYGEPNQPVYLWRYLNGAPEGVQGRYIGTTDASGTLLRESVAQPEWVGCYSFEQVAVGSQGGPRSTPLAYCVHAANAPTTYRLGGFPEYQVGDTATHEIHTDPAQPLQPVYRVRDYNGIEQRATIGQTDANGSLVVSLPVGPEQVGTYSGERVTVGTEDGPQSQPLSYVVHAVQRPTAVRFDSHFPNYQAGDTASLRVTTNPRQPWQPVYRFRSLNGQPDGPQPTWIGTTNGLGIFENSLPASGATAGSYSGEQFAVGTPQGPRSTPALSYTVTGGGGTTAAPTAVRPAPFPIYLVGDTATLIVTTNPPQPEATVFRYRQLNGAADGAQPTAIGTTDSTGRFELSLPVRVEEIGAYTDERFAVGSSSGPTSAPLAYTVSPDPATLVAPEAFRPQPFPNYKVGDTARLLISTDPPQPNQPVYRFRLLNGTPDGAQPTLIGTTDAEGQFNLSTALPLASIGTYRNERFAVGSSAGPTSQAMHYIVHPEGSELSAPIASRLDHYYPTYTAGDETQLQILTDPPQPHQLIFRWRQKDGQADGAQPSPVGITDATGSFLVAATLPEEAAGSYSEEQFAVGSPTGVRSAPLAYTVTGSGLGLSTTGLSPDRLVLDSSTPVTLTGSGLDAAIEVFVADQGKPGVPSATLISTSPAGTSLEAVIDTSDAEPGYYVLVASNGIRSRERGYPFRVVEPGVVVDAWSPSVPGRGQTYLLTIIGSGLANADVFPEQPDRLRVELAERNDDRLFGLLHIEDDAPLGFTRLLIESAAGSTTIALDIAAGENATVGGEFGLGGEGAENDGKGKGRYRVEETDLLAGSSLANQALAAGEPVPQLFTQGIQLNHRVSQHKIPDDTDDGMCPSVNFNFSYSKTIPIVLETFTTGGLGEIGRLLAILYPGTSIDVSTFTLAITGKITIDYTLSYHHTTGWRDSVCYSAELRIDLLGRTMTIHKADCTGLFTSNEPSDGSIIRTSFQGGPCASAEDDGVLDGWLGKATITQEECCQQDLDLFVFGTSFGAPFTYTAQVGETQANCTGGHKIEIRSFIPTNHLSGPPILRCGPPSQSQQIYFEGDGRCFHRSPAASSPQLGYRMQQTAVVFPDHANCSSCNPTGVLSAINTSGMTSTYAEDALVSPSPDRITVADRDGVPNDCHLWLDDAQAGNSTWTVTATPDGPKRLNVRFEAAGANPLSPAAPTIDWNISILLDSSGDKTTYTIDAAHDCFPGFEVYIDDEIAYGFLPPVPHFQTALQCLPWPMNISETCTGVVGQKSNCVFNPYAPCG